MLVTAPEQLREQLRGLTTTALIATCARLRPTGDVADPEQDVATFKAECLAADRAVRTLSLDHTFEGRNGPISLRWVYVHMIEEYARHNGHADLIRESIDGATGD